MLCRPAIRALAILAALALPAAGAGADAAASAGPAVIFKLGGQALGLTAGAYGIAVLEDAGGDCALVVIPADGATPQTHLHGCVLPGADVAVAGSRTAWGGYQDVRCSETTAAVYSAEGRGGRLVQSIPGDCLGYGTSYRGLASDGSSLFYSLLVTAEPDGATNCGEGGPCHWKLAGGRIMRLSPGGPVADRRLPAAALIAADAGRIALVEPAKSASSTGKTFDWPRAATNGKVEVRATATGAVLSSFAPRGAVRAIALAGGKAVVLVATSGGPRFEWYDASTGARLGTASAPSGTAFRISTDGNEVAFAALDTVRVLDLGTGAQRVLARTTGAPVGPSVTDGRVVWVENGKNPQVLAARV